MHTEDPRFHINEGKTLNAVHRHSVVSFKLILTRMAVLIKVVIHVSILESINANNSEHFYLQASVDEEIQDNSKYPCKWSETRPINPDETEQSNVQ